MKNLISILQAHVAEQLLPDNSPQSILALLYECYNELQPMDDEAIKADFDALYRAMNGMELRQMDMVIYPVCTLCHDHERSGFIHGVQVGMRLAQELTE